MLLGLFALVCLAPVYWLVVPERWRREALVVMSLAGLAVYDPRLPLLVLTVVLCLYGLLRAILAWPAAGGRLAALGLAGLALLFVYNKLTGQHMTVLPSQSGLAFLGVSYLALKAGAALIDTAQGALRPASLFQVLEWIVFLPTYPSGPMEDFDHFRAQRPTIDRERVFGGLERIILGLLKGVVLAHYAGEWAAEIFAAPDGRGRGILLLGTYAFSIRFYLDFAGYSDIAIGVGALFGYDIEENFDNPFLRRNLVQLWQRWHMTLTRWLRIYLFIPVSRRLMRRRGLLGDRAAIGVGQIAAMVFCGLWHGMAWNFVLWGLLHALCLLWVGVLARDAGSRLPEPLVRWWRHSRAGYALSTALTFNGFAFLSVLVIQDVGAAAHYWRLLLLGR